MFYQQPYNDIDDHKKNLKPLIGSTVQCNFGGPEKGKGTLLKLGLDYCVLQCDEQVYYYPLHHIKGYALIQEDDSFKENGNTGDNRSKNDGNNKNSIYPVIVPGRRFVDVIDRLKGQEVQFNKGPNKIKGTVVGRDKDHIILEVNDEVVYVSTFHIQNMCWYYCNPNNNKQSGGNSKNGKNNSKNSGKNSSENNSKNSSKNSSENNSKNSSKNSSENSSKSSSKNSSENSSKSSSKNSSENNSKSSSKNSSENSSKNSSKNSSENNSKSSSKNSSKYNSKNSSENSNENSSSINKESNDIIETVAGRDENYIMFEVNDEVLYVSTARIQGGVFWDYYNNTNSDK